MTAGRATSREVPSLVSLDEPRAVDPRLTGAKAAWLARATQAGLPVLPGVVVRADESEPHLTEGREALDRRGSGGARLAVSGRPLDGRLAAELMGAADRLGDPLVVRSSSVIEGDPRWSGAFTSYLDVHPDEVPKAVAGCWASAFTVAALERHRAADVAAGSVPMAVLVQPALQPDFGGTARIEGETTVVTAVAGSPAPLVQGWEPGDQARISASGEVDGERAAATMGIRLLTSVAAVLREAHERLGATACEWATVDGEVTILQLMHSPGSRPASLLPPVSGAAAAPAALVRRYPGPLGETLVLPWAVADPTAFTDLPPPVPMAGAEALDLARREAAALTADVWRQRPAVAAVEAAGVLRSLRGTDPEAALAAVQELSLPGVRRGRRVLALLARVLEDVAAKDAVTRPDLVWHLDPTEIEAVLTGAEPVVRRQRIGFDRWEPFTASVVASTGIRANGTEAAPGVAAGRLWYVDGPGRSEGFRPRDVIVTPYPLPGIAPLLGDAAAIVTTGGGPAAHLFESARALAIPAVCGVHLDHVLGRPLREASGQFVAAVADGSVFVSEW